MKQKITIVFLLLAVAASSAMAQRALYILNQGTGVGRQSLIPFDYGSQFEDDLIRATWDNDEHIIAAGFTYHGLQLATAKHPSWGNQTYAVDTKYPEKFVNSMIDKGYTITELTTDGRTWLAIASEITPARQQLVFSFEGPATEQDRVALDSIINNLTADHFYITDVACAANVWSIVTTHNPDIVDQIYAFPTAAQDIYDFFMKNQVNGYRISAADYGPGHYLCVMTKSKGTPKGQALLPGVENPNEVMDRYWGMQFSITQIGH